MLIKTKKYKLEPALYIKTAMTDLVRQQWWYIFGPVALACLAFIWPSWWFVSIAALIVVGYLLFWAVQFAGATQVEQNKKLFEKMSYEIDGRQILMRTNDSQKTPVKAGQMVPVQGVSWDMIKSAKKTSEFYLLTTFAKGGYIFLPYNIFTSPNDLKMMDAYLKRKNLIAENA